MRQAYGVAALLCAASRLPAAEAPPIGFAAEVVGTWTVNDKPLAGGQRLPPGGRLVLLKGPNGKADAALITVAFRDGKSTTFACQKLAHCADPIVLSRDVQFLPPLALRILETAFALVYKQGASYQPGFTRAGLSSEEAVLRMTDQKVLLGNVHPPAGAYVVEFRPINAAGDAGEVLGDAPMVEIKPGSTAPAIASPPRGLYQMKLLNADSGTAEADTWILVLNAADSAAYGAAFEKAREIAEGWTGDEAGRTRRSFLRATLHELFLEGPG